MRVQHPSPASMVTLATAVALLVGTAAAAQPYTGGLNLNAGTYRLGGTAHFDLDRSLPEAGDGALGFGMLLAPSFGYFFADALAVDVNLSVDKSFGDLYAGPYNMSSLGFGFGLTYYADMGVMVPYVGLGGFMREYSFPEGEPSRTFGGSLSGGVLLPVAAAVAIDLGLSVSYSMFQGGGARLSIPLGYFGVEIFI